MEAVANLARLRAHIEGRQPLPPDLASWVLDIVAANVGRAEVLARRDQHLIAAGELIGGTVNRRATIIAGEARALARCWPRLAMRSPEPGTPRAHIHAARLTAEIPGDRRLREILSAAKVGTPDPSNCQLISRNL